MTLLKKSSFSLLSPAKINLFFLVLNKRSDNFHEIASLYQAISLFDRLTVELADFDQFTCNNKDIENNSNSVIFALELFREHYKINSKVKIHLEKKIPLEAGLGGGSSNAATTLWALNKLFFNGNGEKSLVELSKKIGSDVPFFFSKGSALCTGKGEVVENADIPRVNGWVLKPFFGISTPKVYSSIQNIKVSHDYRELLKGFQLGKCNFVNDLQTPAAKAEPRVLAIQKQYPHAAMTGSGSCFFTLKKPNKSNLIEKVFPFKGVFRKSLGWYSINQ